MATNTGAPTSAASTITETNGSASPGAAPGTSPSANAAPTATNASARPGQRSEGPPRHAHGEEPQRHRHHALAHPDRDADREQLPLLAVGLDHAVGRVRQHRAHGRGHGGGEHARGVADLRLADRLGGGQRQVIPLARGEQPAEERAATA
jgi:hypothetical protein